MPRATGTSTAPPIDPPAPGPRLRVVPAPGHDVTAAPPVGVAAHAQQSLPLEWGLPSGLPAEPPAPRHLRLVDPDEAGPLPPVAPWAARLARTVIEVVSGERPSGQLARWTSRAVHADLSRRAAAAARHPAVVGRPPQCRRVRSVRVFAVSPTVVEACAVVSGAVRSRAVALRLEAVGDRWVATAVEVG